MDQKWLAADGHEINCRTCRSGKTCNAAPKWNRVEDQLPEESGYTIVFCADGDLRHVTFAKYQKTPKRWDLSGARSYWRVLWWMPLPEPPKEDA